MLAVFRSRAQALDCVSLFRRAGISARAVSTPREAGVGCGLSVQFDERFSARARGLLAQRRYSAFWGMLVLRGGRFFAG